jgi:Ca2+-transporting ATPase
VFVGGSAFSVTSISGREWGISLALGFVSLPLGVLIRLVPNAPCARVFAFLRLWRPARAPDASLAPDAEPGLTFAIEKLRHSISVFARVRGGRMRASSLVAKSMGKRPRRAPNTAVGALAVAPSMLVAVIGAPREPQRGAGANLADPAGVDPSKSSAALWENHFELHPETPRDDPVRGVLEKIAGPRRAR